MEFEGGGTVRDPDTDVRAPSHGSDFMSSNGQGRTKAPRQRPRSPVQVQHPQAARLATSATVALASGADFRSARLSHTRAVLRFYLGASPGVTVAPKLAVRELPLAFIPLLCRSRRPS